MIVVQFPEFDIDDVEIFIAEEVPVFVDIGFILDVFYAFEDF